MNQTDKGLKGNEEVCSTTEVQYAEKNGPVAPFLIFSKKEVERKNG